MRYHEVLLPLILSTLLFAAAAWVTFPLDQQYEEDRLALPATVSAGVPADVLLLQQTLGAFRGWAIDALWLKALQRRDQGQLHESMELSRWILKLQPYFPRVWNFQSWLLAFELALDSRDPAERWTWVKESVDLLRGPGLRANPRSSEIHDQLSYLFWFKIGGVQDDASPFFRQRLFQEWNRIVGKESGNKIEVENTLQRFSELLKTPDWQRDLTIEEKELLGFENSSEEGPYEVLVQVLSVLDQDRITTEQSKLLDRLRCRVIVEAMNMSPRLMLQLNQWMGPIDWRVPAAHAVYWGVQGELRRETGEIDVDLTQDLLADVLLSNHVRIGLQQLILQGRPVLNRNTGDLLTIGPLPEFLPVYLRALEELGNGEQIPDQFLGRTKELMGDTALKAWLLEEDSLSEEIIARLLRLEGASEEKVLQESNRPLVDRLAQLVLQKLEPDEALKEITIPLQASTLVAAAGGGVISEARRGQQLVETLEKSLDQRERRSNRYFSLILALRSPRASAPLTVKSRIWQTLSEELRQEIDDATRSVLREDARLNDVEAEISFPGL
ncbi:hypothetical protein OAU96_01995 [Planctomycetota bacterium]|nr:hypothetical protein [Planctomycetota bacterium]